MGRKKKAARKPDRRSLLIDVLNIIRILVTIAFYLRKLLSD